MIVKMITLLHGHYGLVSKPTGCRCFARRDMLCSPPGSPTVEILYVLGSWLAFFLCLWHVSVEETKVRKDELAVMRGSFG